MQWLTDGGHAVTREPYGLETIARSGSSIASIEWQRRFADSVSRAGTVLDNGHEQQDARSA
ncbi:hypothetical protein GN244_ATG18578 [Phytophthora infestans]|uniref:Uncharacterized protein n=1 Tax=Phytophthora infestans TaxID=4787 RepID=A0A833S8D3_PHYIN|nr:hypothetical protein GN244_ATG18578 [Phytophthora infestans]KAF4143634.1 hypothetical protein GN958_ATG07154 [Phytophthora infestans]